LVRNFYVSNLFETYCNELNKKIIVFWIIKQEFEDEIKHVTKIDVLSYEFTTNQITHVKNYKWIFYFRLFFLEILEQTPI
jgi:hypothetical protein